MIIRLGKVTNTHGIRGEIRILSNFEKKDKVFKKGFKLYFGNEKILETISCYRPHKEYDMVTLNGYADINEVLKYKGLSVYIDTDDINLDDNEFIYAEVIGFNVIFNDKNVGQIIDIMYNNGNNLFVIKSNKDFFVPINDNFIKKVNKDKKEIVFQNIEGLM